MSPGRVLSRLTPRTLRGRLSLVALTTAALLMTVLTVVFNVAMSRHLQHQADDELRSRAAAVATTVDTGGRQVRVVETANDGLLDTNVWIYAGTRLLEKPPSTTPRSPLARTADRLAAQRTPACTTSHAHGDQPVRLCSRPLTGRHAAATVVTALDLGPYRSSADTLLSGSLILDAFMLACTYLLTRLAVGRALRPVRTMTDQATQWSAVGSDDRFGADAHPAELARLGASLDALLDRIRTVLRHEQQLTGELSHELRTPLTRIIIELDWWRARPRTDAETRATHEVIAEAAQSMRSICDTLLTEARENALNPSATAETTDVVGLLDRVIQRLDMPDAVKATVGPGVPGVEAGVAPALLERIVSPLLANAARYARSDVNVAVRRVPGTVRIDVVDDGPGVPEAFVGELFQPGRRADDGDGHDGAGLGLPLARRLARSVGGDVSYDPAHTPGARFTVSLPAA
ncbi:HAMP domain-containing sensor histidine kinase [Streptomyces sp. NPDC005917]|uniref:HAMP domain-containing sensor histidine kinase n=1 Tax=unclassified Streptomyces TaxID=2593676 RepID=UPI0033DA4713